LFIILISIIEKKKIKSEAELLFLKLGNRKKEMKSELSSETQFFYFGLNHCFFLKKISNNF